MNLAKAASAANYHRHELTRAEGAVAGAQIALDKARAAVRAAEAALRAAEGDVPLARSRWESAEAVLASVQGAAANGGGHLAAGSATALNATIKIEES